MQERISRLQRRDRGYGSGTLHLINVEVRNTDMADFAFALERGHGRPSLFDFVVGVWPMDLIQVDDVSPKSPQAGLTFAANRVGFEIATDLPALVPDHTALGEYIWPLTNSSE